MQLKTINEGVLFSQLITYGIMVSMALGILKYADEFRCKSIKQLKANIGKIDSYIREKELYTDFSHPGITIEDLINNNGVQF